MFEETCVLTRLTSGTHSKAVITLNQSKNLFNVKKTPWDILRLPSMRLLLARRLRVLSGTLRHRHRPFKAPEVKTKCYTEKCDVYSRSARVPCYLEASPPSVQCERVETSSFDLTSGVSGRDWVWVGRGAPVYWCSGVGQRDSKELLETRSQPEPIRQI